MTTLKTLQTRNYKLRRELKRLVQFIEHERMNTRDPGTWVNLDAASDGQCLHQQMPGWDRRRPLEEQGNRRLRNLLDEIPYTIHLPAWASRVSR